MISIAAAILAAPRLKMTTHTARVYVIATFLLLSVLDPTHAILPLLVFLVHAICKRINPSSSRHPELDVVSSIALISFFWLALGRTNNTFNIPLYGLTTLSMTLSFCALFVSQSMDRTRIVTCLLLGASGTLFYFLFYRTPPDINAMPVDIPVFTGTCLVSFILPLLVPQIFKSLRVFKVAGLALVSPLAIYAGHMFQ